MNRLEMLTQLLMEEASEVSQAASKCARFTFNHAHYDESNIARLQTEITDLITVLTMIEDEIKVEFSLERSLAKRERIEEYLEISRKLGALQ